MNVAWLARLFGRAGSPTAQAGITNVEQLLALPPALMDPARADASERSRLPPEATCRAAMEDFVVRVRQGRSLAA